MFMCRHSSVVYRLSSVTYCQFTGSSDHQFFKSSLFFASLQLTLLLPCLRWWLVDDCCLLAWHRSGVAVWSHNFAAAVCDACQHPSPCSLAGTGLLVMTWCHLLPVCHRQHGCDCCHASTSWTSFLSSLCYWLDQCSQPSELAGWLCFKSSDT